MSMTYPNIDVRLKKVNKIYNEGELLSGVVVVMSKLDLQHQGITLTLEGVVTLQLSAKSVGLFEAFYNSLKPMQLISVVLEIAKPGRFPPGKTEIPFEIPLKAKPGRKLFETYHGVFVNIQYLVRVDMKRGMLSKDLDKQTEFIIESMPRYLALDYYLFDSPDSEEKAVCKPQTFSISPDTLQNVKEKKNVPRFKVSGKLDTISCCITKPFTGELTVNHCEMAIKSIEVQLVRVETCGCAEGYAKDATEIQNIQIADGDVCRGLTIPIYMVFPRLFTCPTLFTSNFKVEFELNIVLVFQDDHLVTENFPIKLYRY